VVAVITEEVFALGSRSIKLKFSPLHNEAKTLAAYPIVSLACVRQLEILLFLLPKSEITEGKV